MTGSPYPPDFIKLPPAIACAGIDDVLVVTMARILGLFVNQDHLVSAVQSALRLWLAGVMPETLPRH